MTMKTTLTIKAVALSALLLTGAAHAQVGEAQVAQLQTMEQFLTVMENYYALIERIHATAADSDKAAIHALVCSVPTI